MRNRPSSTRCRRAGRLGPSKGSDPQTSTYSTTPRLCNEQAGGQGPRPRGRPPAPAMHGAHVLLPRRPAGGLRMPSPRRPPGLRTAGSHTTWTAALRTCRNSQIQSLTGKETGGDVTAEPAGVAVSNVCTQKRVPHPPAWHLPASLMSMLLSSSRFSVLRSRCTIWWLWQYSTAERICQNFFRASFSLRCPLEVK